MTTIRYEPLPPGAGEHWVFWRCFGIGLGGSIPAVACGGCTHLERWEPADGLTGPNGSHAALRRLLEHVASCPKVMPYPAPKEYPLDVNAGPTALLPVPGKEDAYIACYGPVPDAAQGVES